MEDQIITFKTAEIAKRKGLYFFHKRGENRTMVNCNYFYDPVNHFPKEEPIHIFDMSNYVEEAKDRFLFAPTQSLLKKWLRELHKLHVEAWYNASGWGWEISTIFGTHIAILDINGQVEDTNPDSGMFSTYELALEKGLQEALKMLKNPPRVFL
jgi:hypothetical protein